MERNEEKNSRVQLETADKVQPVEITAEITLPDYRSEISRLLWVRPTLLPPTRFIGGGKADFSGPVRYDILYTGPDGGLYSAETEEGYAFSVPVETPAGVTEGQELLAELTPEAVISRVTGPRKLSVRCRMHARVRCYGEKDLSPRVKGQTESAAVQRLCEAVDCGRVLPADMMHFEVSTAVEMEPAPGEPRLILAEGTLFLPDVTATENGARCRGEVLLSLLVSRENGEGGMPPQLITERIPFEQELPMTGVTPDCGVRAMGKVSEVRTTVEDGRILADVGVALWGEGQAEETVILCRDMFLPGASTSCQFGEERLQGGGVCANRNFTVSGEQLLSELNLAGDILPIYNVADAKCNERRMEGDKTILSGEMHCHTLYMRDGEYGVAEFSVPFRTAVEGAWDAISADVTVPRCRVSLARDAIRADGEVLLALRGNTFAPTRVLTEATFAPAEMPARADLELCYPAGGETLWDVGRRYGISPEQIAAANGLGADTPGSADSLNGVKYLLIPS